MYKKALFFFLAVLTVIAPVSAQSGSDQVRNQLKSAGYEVTGSRSQGGMPVWDLRTDGGMRFSVAMIGSFGTVRSQAVKSLLEIISGLKGLVPDSVRFVFEENRATAIVIPRSFEIGGQAYADYMPSGMQFIYDDAPAYDFRMLVENLAVRINGAFLTNQQFLDRIVRAVENPAAYIQSSDPQFLAQQIQELQRLFDRISAQLAQQAEAMAQGDAELSGAVSQAVREGEQALHQVIRQGEETTEEIHQRITELQVQTEAAFEDVALEHAEFRDQFSRLREGLVILASRNIFGSLKEIAPATAERVVELRRANPDLSADEARAQVNSELPDEATPLHKKHVQAIYALFFNDYR